MPKVRNLASSHVSTLKMLCVSHSMFLLFYITREEANVFGKHNAGGVNGYVAMVAWVLISPNPIRSRTNVSLDCYIVQDWFPYDGFSNFNLTNKCR